MDRPLQIDVCTTFPAVVDSYMGESIMKRASASGLVRFCSHDLRDFTHDAHRTTDDYPYGGGDGLLMKCGPIFECLESVLGLPAGSLPLSAKDPLGSDVPVGQRSIFDTRDTKATRELAHLPRVYRNAVSASRANLDAKIYGEGVRVVYLSPHGRRFDDSYACELSAARQLVFVCGHYEGIDERAYSVATDVVSLGDFVLTGGELGALCVIDATVRKLPGALGAADGASLESFAAASAGLLEYPQYTRPSSFRGMDVPDVLLSGHHAKIAKWQRERSLEVTFALRPDLIEAARLQSKLTAEDEQFLHNLE